VAHNVCVGSFGGWRWGAWVRCGAVVCFWGGESFRVGWFPLLGLHWGGRGVHLGGSGRGPGQGGPSRGEFGGWCGAVGLCWEGCHVGYSFFLGRRGFFCRCGVVLSVVGGKSGEESYVLLFCGPLPSLSCVFFFFFFFGWIFFWAFFCVVLLGIGLSILGFLGWFFGGPIGGGPFAQASYLGVGGV